MHARRLYSLTPRMNGNYVHNPYGSALYTITLWLVEVVELGQVIVFQPKKYMVYDS